MSKDLLISYMGGSRKTPKFSTLNKGYNKNNPWKKKDKIIERHVVEFFWFGFPLAVLVWFKHRTRLEEPWRHRDGEAPL